MILTPSGLCRIKLAKGRKFTDEHMAKTNHRKHNIELDDKLGVVENG